MEGDLSTCLGIKYVSVVYMRFIAVLVVVAQDILSAGEMGVVRINEHTHTTRRRLVYVAFLVYGKMDPVPAND